MARDISHRAAFESQGETYTRVLAQQDDNVGRQATAWLAEQQSLRDEDAASKRDMREAETLEIAKEANRIASRAERWAMYAAIAAVIALIISIVRN